ncbi:hypothetical protein BY996DRAFT_8516734 [Phakopsora pachyrhizi]|nr:hypothetical protein BY996DRAFT_8516734 [Phakopsora pachyrhizi]
MVCIPTHPQKANPLITKKHHHPPRFTVPEPVELDIEPILPIRFSTSPSTSLPSIPKPSYMMNFRSMIGQPSHHLLDNYSNIFDESGGGFLGEGMTTINERSTTEQSIDFNHLTLMGILGSGGWVCGAGIEPRKLQSVNNRIDKSQRETTDGLDDHAMNLKQRLEAMRETEDDGSADVNGFIGQMERARAICNKRPLQEEKEQYAGNDINNMSNSKGPDTESLSSKTVVRTDGNTCNQLNQDQSEGDVDKMRTVKTLDSQTAPLTSQVTFEKPRSLPPPSSLLRPRKTMPNLGSLETPANLSLATAKKKSSKTSLPPNSSSGVQKPGSTTSTANTITRTTRSEKRLSAPLSLNSNASRPPLFNTSIKKPRFMSTDPLYQRLVRFHLTGGTKLKPSTKDCSKNGLPRVLKTQSSISSKLAKRESLVVSKATIPSSIKSSASASTIVKKGATINVEKRRSMIEIKSREYKSEGRLWGATPLFK